MRILAASLLTIVMFISTVEAGEMITVNGANGEKFNAYIAGPANAGAGALILHDWFGLTDFTKESVDRLGQQGLRAMAVDLFNGLSAETHDQAGVLAGKLEADYAQSATLAGLSSLKAGQIPVAVIGYSMGGRTALRTAAQHPDLIKAAALIYAGGYDGTDDKSLAAAGPILSITGSADEWAYSEQAILEKRLLTVDRNLESYVYPGAVHAFAQPLFNEGKTYDKVATQAMRDVLDSFLKRHLGIAM